MNRICQTLLCSVPVLTIAAAPLPGTEDYEILAPYARWVQSVHDNDGRWCCDIADGRPVLAKIEPKTAVWLVFISRAKFGPTAPDTWVTVAEKAIRRIPNPTGMPIAWWYSNEVRCFVPGDGT